MTEATPESGIACPIPVRFMLKFRCDICSKQLDRTHGRESREAAPRDPASPRPTGRGRSRRCRHRRAPVPRHAVPARDRTRALARRLADAGQVARRLGRLAQPPGPPGDALAGPASPARASRARPPASRPSFLPVRESAGREASGRPRAPPTRRHASAPVPARIRASPGAGAHVVAAHGWPPIPRHTRWITMGTLPSVVASRRRSAATEPSRLTGGPLGAPTQR